MAGVKAEPTEPDEPGTGRTEAFSDGVFAIAITLLVLDLALPHYEPGHLWSALVEHWPAYVAFVVSFVYIGIIWLNHHALFRRIRRMSLGLNWANLGLLIGAVVLPFPTAVLAEAFGEGSESDRRIAVAFYALVAAAMSAAWLILFVYLNRHRHLLRAAVSPEWPGTQRQRPLTGIALYLLGAAIGLFVNPVAGLLCIVGMIAYHGLTSEGICEGPLGRLLRRRRRAQ